MRQHFERRSQEDRRRIQEIEQGGDWIEEDQAQNTADLNRSTIVRAMFAKSVTRILRADGGSIVNLLPRGLLVISRRKEAYSKNLNSTGYVDMDLQWTTMNQITWCILYVTRK